MLGLRAEATRVYKLQACQTSQTLTRAQSYKTFRLYWLLSEALNAILQFLTIYHGQKQ